MLSLTKPDSSKLALILAEQSTLSLSYDEVGLSETAIEPAGYHNNSCQTVLGSGESTYERALSAMKAWNHFDVGNVRLFPPQPRIEIDTNLLVYAHHCGIWSTNACRILYVINESTDSKRRFGYGYGTLPQHVERGEERFLLELDSRTDEVTYVVSAYSKSNHILVSTFWWPFAIKVQDDFRRNSVQAMKRKCGKTV